MKIVYLLRNHTNSGGIERVVSKKANYLVNHGYDVYLVTLTVNDEPVFFDFDPKIKFHNLDIGNSPDKKTFVNALGEYLHHLKPDIVISTGVLVTNYLYEIKDGSKKILEYHFAKYKKKYKLARFDKFLPGKIFNKIYSYKRTRIASRYDRFVVLTNEDRKDWGDLKNIHTIHNPLSFIPESVSDVTAKRVIAVGRYTGQKGFDYLIPIWAKVNKQFPDWKLSIFGSGSKKEKLQQLICKYGLQDSIELLPPTVNIEEEYRKSSINVMTSRYEGFALVLTEAMACGLPVVSYASKSGPRDIIRDGEDGFLIKMHDEKDFARKLALLMGDYELRKKMGKAGRINIMRYTEDKIMPQWVQLFEEVLKED